MVLVSIKLAPWFILLELSCDKVCACLFEAKEAFFDVEIFSGFVEAKTGS